MLLHPEGRVLSTLEQDGSRRWLYPRLAKGRFWLRRRIVAYILIAIFMLIPYLRISGKPAMLLDIVHRRFTLFGLTFLPTDTVLLALLAVSTILLIFFVTALFGRVWCGWACPQTVYMEFLFRPIERLFTGRTGKGGTPREEIASWRIVAMYATYVLASFYLAHTFLSYFVGVDQLRHWVTASPADHPAAFVLILATTGAMLFNFAFFREQTCIIACPYGRFQSVLMDRWSLLVSYDRTRGEPRGPIHKRTSLPVVNHGDCVDCGLCEAVCPTGIDIRNGLQIECVGCAQCIDVCDAVMTKLGRPVGLIRYGSQSGMAGEKRRILRPRIIIYPTIMALLLGLLVFLLANRPPADVTVLRGLGLPFVMTDAGEVENVMRIKITNRTDEPQQLQISVVDRSEVRAISSDDSIRLAPGQSCVEPVRFIAPAAQFELGTLNLKIRVSGPGVKIDRPVRLVGPVVMPVKEDESHGGGEHERH